MKDTLTQIVECHDGDFKQKTSHPITGRGYYWCPYDKEGLDLCDYCRTEEYEINLGKKDIIYKCIKGEQNDKRNTLGLL